MLRLIEELNLEKLHLIGHDIGGGIVQLMMVNAPERFHSVTMLNPVGYDYWPVQPIISMRTPIFRQFAMAAFDMGYYKTILRKAIFREETFTDELMKLFWSNFDSQASKKSFLRFARCLNNNDLMEIVEKLKESSMQVLILRAEKDVYLSSEITRRLHDDIRESKLTIIPRSGHYMQEDAPEEIVEALIEFWD